MAAFQKGMDCVYCYQYGESFEEVWTGKESGRCFRDYESCCEAIRCELAEYPEADREKHLRWMAILWDPPDSVSECGIAYVDAEVRLKNIAGHPSGQWDFNAPDFDSVCSETCIAIPTPFCRGDLAYHSGEGSFVLDYIHTWDLEKRLENGFSEKEAEKGDQEMRLCFWTGEPSGMWTYGYKMREDFGVWYDEPGCQEYFDLEYYTGSLEGKEQVLKPISEYLKGNYGLELLLNGCTFLMLEESISSFGRAIIGLTQKEGGGFWDFRIKQRGNRLLSLRKICYTGARRHSGAGAWPREAKTYHTGNRRL